MCSCLCYTRGEGDGWGLSLSGVLSLGTTKGLRPHLQYDLLILEFLTTLKGYTRCPDFAKSSGIVKKVIDLRERIQVGEEFS